MDRHRGRRNRQLRSGAVPHLGRAGRAEQRLCQGPGARSRWRLVGRHRWGAHAPRRRPLFTGRRNPGISGNFCALHLSRSRRSSVGGRIKAGAHRRQSRYRLFAGRRSQPEPGEIHPANERWHALGRNRLRAEQNAAGAGPFPESGRSHQYGSGVAADTRWSALDWHHRPGRLHV